MYVCVSVCSVCVCVCVCVCVSHMYETTRGKKNYGKCKHKPKYFMHPTSPYKKKKKEY